ncbi:MAG: hypothetical protein A3F10_00880 [Coxiella sp. RIFCSPHIGHO2_12_FULL_42_15]|nr:MAG: hypothetical protein A3F10_00880 [Coxiella sp. RIFCSPHIGHO2_12_FULL_42_15]
MKNTCIWRVALSTPLTQCFDYLPPHVLPNKVVPGIRVRVSFGWRDRIGILLAVVNETEVPADKLKVVQAVLDEEPLLSAELIKLCFWLSDYYHQAIGEVLMRALPKRLREGKILQPKPLVFSAGMTSQPHELNEHQHQAVTAILQQPHFRCFLLAGVTGSGKTEVYLRAISAVLARKKQVLMLVPEISLTPQTVRRLQDRLPVPMVVMHSRLSASECANRWWQAKFGDVAVVIGTRSAVFAPLSRLGLIIVDEEHDASFKSQSGVRYSARDVAVMRAHQANIPIVLGSATPALESYYNVMRKRYTLLTLPLRAGNAKPPNIRVLDVRKQPLQAGLSDALLQAIKTHLSKGQQVLLFINRRGYAPVMLCHQCGYLVVCSRCDAKLTYHVNPARLICHHCEKVVKPQKICPKCHQADLITLGQGTEQIETVLTSLLPQHRIVRVDRDTTSKKNSLDEKLAQINAGEADILIGTQMLAKGHHFENLGLSAILDMDSGFFSVDFRALERMAQLLVQVSGRAGRGEATGEVIVQTHHPDHPYLALILGNHYFEFLKTILQERWGAKLPPYCQHAIIRAESVQRQRSMTFLQQVKNLIPEDHVEVIGPMPARLARKAGKFRQQLLVQSSSRLKLQSALQDAMKFVAKLPSARSVRWSVDVDPIEGV